MKLFLVKEEETMPILACGINHKTAPIAIREQASFDPNTMAQALQELLHLDAVNEAMILSTCNRTELYSNNCEPKILVDWLAKTQQLQVQTLEPHFYIYQDKAAVRHIMRVASGLDSMVLGEPQILGQMKQAYAMAHETGAIGGHLNRLFQTVFSATKEVRTFTDIGRCPVSIAFSAVNIANRIFTDLKSTTVLLVGAGETIELAAMHLANQEAKRIIIANRSLEKAEELASRVQGMGIRIGDVPLYLAEADIVVSATASQLPILGKGLFERALRVRKHRPMLLVDLAVPRDIEPEVAELPDVYLYNIDDLETMIQESHQSRQSAAAQAEAIIDIQVSQFMRELKGLSAVDTIKSYREKMEQMRDKEVIKALKQVELGADTEKVLAELAYNLTNKFLHDPTKQIRQAALDGKLDRVLEAKRLLGL